MGADPMVTGAIYLLISLSLLRSKSLRTFIAAHENLSGVRFSLSPYREQDWMRNIPLYAVGAFFGIRHPYTLA